MNTKQWYSINGQIYHKHAKTPKKHETFRWATRK